MLLTTLLVGSLAGAVVCALAPRASWAKWMALAISTVLFVYSLSLARGFDPSDGGFQFSVDKELLPAFGVRFQLGLDGISLWLVILTAFLTPLVVLGSFKTIMTGERGYYALLLFLEMSLIGALTALDLVLFYVFWELMLVPMFFLIGLWGGAGRVYATLKFVLFTLVGSLPMLVAILIIGHLGRTFDYLKLVGERLPPDVQIWCFLAFALAFVIKVPLVPFHTWLPDAHTEAPAGGSVLLAGVLLKMGAYGLLRFCLPLFPEASKDFAPFLVVLAVVGILHGALAAAVQPDMKRLVAYSSVSHMGFIVLGIFTFTLQGLQGGVLQMLSHALSTSALFFLVGMLYDQRHSRKIEDYGGLARVVPAYSVAFLFASLAAAALPGLCGFVGEYLILSSVWTVAPVAVAISVLAVILGAWYLLSLFGRVFLGPVAHEANQKLKDMSLREACVLIPMLVLMLYIGLKPAPFLAPMEKSIQLSVLDRMKPPPVMTDFAAQERRAREMEETFAPKSPRRSR